MVKICILFTWSAIKYICCIYIQCLSKVGNLLLVTPLCIYLVFAVFLTGLQAYFGLNCDWVKKTLNKYQQILSSVTVHGNVQTILPPELHHHTISVTFLYWINVDQTDFHLCHDIYSALQTKIVYHQNTRNSLRLLYMALKVQHKNGDVNVGIMNN